MENKQLNLFGNQEFLKDEANSELKIEQKDKSLNNTLFAIKDGKEADLTIDEIFDKKFTKIKAITYSIDANFINKYDTRRIHGLKIKNCSVLATVIAWNCC